MARRRGHGEGSIRKRADGRWEALLSDGYDGQGRRLRRNFLGRTRGEVQRKLDEARQRLQAGEPVADDRRSVAEFLEQWLGYAEQRVRPRTFERYRSIVRQHLIPQLGNLQLAKVSPAHVERMLAAQLDSGSRRRPSTTTAGCCLTRSTSPSAGASSPATSPPSPRPPR